MYRSIIEACVTFEGRSQNAELRPRFVDLLHDPVCVAVFVTGSHKQVG